MLPNISILMKLAIVGGKPAIGNKEMNLKKMKKSVEETDADIIIFGELFLTGYRCTNELRNLAEGIDGKSIGEVKRLAEENGCHIVYGMPLKDSKRVYNAAVLVHPNGELNIYKKMFLPNFGPFEEKKYFSHGKCLPVFNTDFGKIGLCICYDLFFPEVIKSYAMKGADLVVCISASPSLTRKFFEAILPARAIENTLFVAYANLVGKQEDLVFWGGGQAYGPKGDLLVKAPYFEESVVKCRLNFDELKDAREMRPTLIDTRAELFADLHDIASK